MAKTYTVKQGDTIQDAAFNVAGSLAGIDPILEKNTPTTYPPVDWKSIEYREEVPERNFMESYTPSLRPDQILDVEDVNVDNLEATQGMLFNSSLDNPVSTDVEVRKLILATALQGRGVASSLISNNGGFISIKQPNSFLTSYFYNKPFSIQVVFKFPQESDTHNVVAHPQNIFDTSFNYAYPRFQLQKTSTSAPYKIVFLYGLQVAFSMNAIFGYIYNFTIVNDGSGTVKIYLNNELYTTAPFVWKEYASFLSLGCYVNTSVANFIGDVILSRFFDRALSIDEVAALNNDGAPQDFVVPADMKVGCVAEYIPQNIIPLTDDDNTGYKWLDSSMKAPIDNNTPPILVESLGGYDLGTQDMPAISHKPIYSSKTNQIATTSDGKGLFYTPNPANTNGFLDNDYTVQLIIDIPHLAPKRENPFNMCYNNIAPRFTIDSNKAEMVVSNIFTEIPVGMYRAYSLIWVRNGDTVSLYNGQDKIGDVPFLTGRDNNISILNYSIGSNYGYSSNVYGFRCFNRALSDNEISELWHSGAPQDFVVPAEMKQSCIREYLPINISPLTSNPDVGYSWWSSHNVMPNSDGILEPMLYPPAEYPNINLVAVNNPKIIKL